MQSWLYRTTTTFSGKRLHRLGLAGNYGVDEGGIRAAMDRGVNLFLWSAPYGELRNPLRAALKQRREDVAVMSFPRIGWFGWGVRRGAEALLRELGTDYIDVYVLGYLGVSSAWTSAIERELVKLRESGKVRAFGVSIHDRPRAARLAASSPLDLLMIRYNAAHPGAEGDVFAHEREVHPSIVTFTATSWGRLLKRPKGWHGPVMTASDCYRFQLSSPHVDFTLMGPGSRAEVEQNLDGLQKGPLTADEEKWMRDFGHAVRAAEQDDPSYSIAYSLRRGKKILRGHIDAINPLRK